MPTELYDSVEAWGFMHPSFIVPAVFFNKSLVTPERNLTVLLGGGICPEGFYCPPASSLPIVCPNGTVGIEPGLSDAGQCDDCPSGYYCPGNATANSTSGEGVDLYQVRYDCPSGFYCETNSSAPRPCPEGTFGISANLHNASGCLPCPGGHYCEEGTGSSGGTGLCAEGYYCTSGATTPTPIDGVTGGICMDGFYCGEGTVTPQPCRGGKFCLGHPTPTLGNCAAGYYCEAASNTSTPVELRDLDGVIVADVCWAGFYCVEGSTTPQACPAGTYNDVTGATDESFCLPCDEGYYCPLAGNLSSSRQPCPANFYCPAGTAEPYENGCPVGHYCDGLDAAPIPCPASTFQDLPQQSSCKQCPAGYACGNATVVPVPCSAGRYCEAGSTVGEPCPAGKFGNQTYLEQCLTCTEGWLCTETGLQTPNVPCPAGYYCQPGGQILGDAIACPVGTYSNLTGLAYESQCLHCPAGQYCDQIALAEPVDDCDGGYYCEDGSPTPVQFTCAAGTYCPVGSTQPIECPMGHYCGSLADAPLACDAGTYNSHFGASSVSACLACPKGHYCPSGSEYPLPCPLGSHTTTSGNEEYADCTACPAGYYCLQNDEETQQLPCIDGYYCPGGDYYPLLRCPVGHFCSNGSATPTECDAGTYSPGTGHAECFNCPEKFWCEDGAVQPLPCPQGYACPSRTTAPEPCPIGTFSNRTDLSSIAECDPCIEGHYCPTEHLVHPLPCAAGHFCRNASTVASPVECDGYSTAERYGNSTTTFPWSCAGGTCVAGYYCPEGSILPTGSGPCPVGTYCPAGTASILDCPLGSFAAVEGSTECALCPSGHYCPTASKAELCPVTTYNPVEGSNSSVDCLTCDPGFQCPEGSFEQVPCPPGYYCPGGEDVLICPERYYCPLSSSAPVECPVEHFCPEGAVEPTVCPPGSYCADDWNNPDASEQGSAAPIPCPNGTYSPLPTDVVVNSVTRYGCINCPPGYFCPEGSSGPNQCMEGFYCPVKSAGPTKCPDGASCPLGSSSPVECEIGYYCPTGTGGSAFLCPVGSYCPAGVSQPILCPSGTADANPEVRGSYDDTCELCAPGTAGADPTRAECLPCEAGHVCSGPGTNTTTPVEEKDLGYVCPAGHYCVEGSSIETPCPLGTFSTVVGATSSDVCSPCDANHYNNRMGQLICHPCGGTSTSNASAATCTCIGKNRVFLSATGECRCRGRYTDENDGLTDGLTDCVPIPVPASCESDQVRDSSEQCVDKDDCSSECVYGGTRLPSGLCSCDVLQSARDVCGDGSTDCLDSLPKYYLDKWGALHIVEDGVDTNVTVCFNFEHLCDFFCLFLVTFLSLLALNVKRSPRHYD